MSNVDNARIKLEQIIDSPEDAKGFEKAAEVVIAAKDPPGLELLATALELVPRAELLAPLWKLAEDKSARKSARSFALQAITAVLVRCRIALEQETEFNVLPQEQVVAHVKRLVSFYKEESYADDLRRRALEMAGNASRAPEIIKAGEEALKRDDPLWAATGLFVCRITQPERARELVEQALHHASTELHYEAIAGLAELGESQDFERLKDFIYDGDADERSAALWALVETPGAAAGDTLVEATRWLQGTAKFEATSAYEQWLARWTGVQVGAGESRPRSDRMMVSRRGLDRYLSDDFLPDAEEDDDDDAQYGD